MEKYQLHKQIGSGAFSSVLKATNKSTNEIVAIKKMNKKFSSWDECLSLNEIKSLTKLKHTNIIKLIEVIRSNDELFCVFEYAPQTLYTLYLKYKEKGQILPEKLIKSFIYQTTQGLVYMHKNGFFHRDMKPENLLLTEGNLLKIADFGLAREIRSRPPFTEYVSTRWYRAPELLLKSPSYNSPVDIYALGLIMAELYNQSPLFAGASEIDQLNKMCSVLGSPNFSTWSEGMALANNMHYTFPHFPAMDLSNVIQNANDLALSLIKDMLSMDPSKRPTALQILQHAYFNDVELPKTIDFKEASPNKMIKKNQKNIVKANNALDLGSLSNQEEDEKKTSIENIENNNSNKELNEIIKKEESFEKLRSEIKTPEDFIPGTMCPKEIFRKKKEETKEENEKKTNKEIFFDQKNLEKEVNELKKVISSSNANKQAEKPSSNSFIIRKHEIIDHSKDLSHSLSPMKMGSNDKSDKIIKGETSLEKINMPSKFYEKTAFYPGNDEFEENKTEDIFSFNSSKPKEINLFQKKQNLGGSSVFQGQGRGYLDNNFNKDFDFKPKQNLPKPTLPKLNPLGNLKDFKEFNANSNDKALEDFIQNKSSVVGTNNSNNMKLPELGPKLQSNRLAHQQNFGNSYLAMKEEKNRSSPIKKNFNLNPIQFN